MRYLLLHILFLKANLFAIDNFIYLFIIIIIIAIIIIIIIIIIGVCCWYRTYNMF